MKEKINIKFIKIHFIKTNLGKKLFPNFKLNLFYSKSEIKIYFPNFKQLNSILI